MLRLQAHAAPGQARATLAVAVIAYAGCFRLGEVVPVATFDPRKHLRAVDLAFGPHDAFISLQMRATNTQTGKKKGFSVDTMDPDAVSADPATREAFRKRLCADYARHEGWSTEHTVVEFDSKIKLPEAKEYVCPCPRPRVRALSPCRVRGLMLART